MKQGSFPPAGLCCPRPSGGTTTPSDSLVAARHFPVVAGYRRARFPDPQTRGHRGPLQFPRHPSGHSTPPTPEGSLAPAPGSQVPSMAFATGMQARLPLGPLARGFLTTPQASLHAADWPVALRPASTPGSRPRPGAALPGTLASPRAGLPPAGCRELVARLHRRFLLSVTSAPELLDAHSGGINSARVSELTTPLRAPGPSPHRRCWVHQPRSRRQGRLRSPAWRRLGEAYSDFSEGLGRWWVEIHAASSWPRRL
jgi:hypothetical protein